jgi:phage tail-like protein
MSSAVSEDNISLLVQRAGTATEFPLQGRTVHFGYAPRDQHDLVLYDSLLDDEQGVIEYRPGHPDAYATPYWLRALGADVRIDGKALPVRKEAVIQLMLGQRIQVGRHYHLTVMRVSANGQRAVHHTAWASAQPSSVFMPALPPALASYMAISRLFLPYLPELYRSDETAGPDTPDLLARFLALFESVFLPLQWTVQHFALCLHPHSAPPDLLPWLFDWYGFPADLAAVPTARRRELLASLPHLLEGKGTVAGLHALLELLEGTDPTIVDDEVENHFTVEITPPPTGDARTWLCALIDWYKPAYTTYELKK